jgi:hypothetical protein
MCRLWMPHQGDRTYSSAWDVNLFGIISRMVPIMRKARWHRIRTQRKIKLASSNLRSDNKNDLEHKPVKFVSIGKPAGVRTTPVSDCTCATIAVGWSPDPDVSCVTSSSQINLREQERSLLANPDLHSLPPVTTMLNLDAWVDGLEDHPDSAFADTIASYITHRVPLLYDGPPLNQVYANWKSCDV